MNVLISVAIADDDPLFRSGIRLALETAPDIVVVAEAEDGAQAEQMVRESRPDVLLLDLRMPEVDGLTVLAGLNEQPGAPAVIVITTFDFDEHIVRALRLGVRGFMVKGAHRNDLVHAVRVAATGGIALDPHVTERVAHAYVQRETRRGEALGRISSLPQRERRVLAVLGLGASNAEIAEALGLSEATVKTYVSHLMERLGMRNRVQLALLSHEAGLPASGVE
ncbi:response regulator [Sinosporangium siamense]|uniref:DNA-binding response regulator n=1 Tax=Sinosporangium siamense TaxID=1367973 RepID=A0A919RKQ9_9ACTN|nr:response regulator transcription factor [Sinosporangium siamense]GII95022.1 DNA-binding response regulator [Sinosporangium siamense]